MRFAQRGGKMARTYGGPVECVGGEQHAHDVAALFCYQLGPGCNVKSACLDRAGARGRACQS